MIQKPPGTFRKIAYGGSGLALEKFAGIDSSGNAVSSDNTSSPFIPPVGIVRHLESDYAILQSDGEIPLTSTTAGQNYWLSTSGNISSTPPTSGVVQKVGIGLPNNKLLVKIDTDILSL